MTLVEILDRCYFFKHPCHNILQPSSEVFTERGMERVKVWPASPMQYIVLVFFVFIYLAESSYPARPEISFPVWFLPKHSNELGDAGSTCHSVLSG